MFIMTDIFRRTDSSISGAFDADQAKLMFGPGFGLLTEQLNFNYAQRVTKLYEVGSDQLYYVGGCTRGQLNVNRTVGPSRSVRKFYGAYGDVCQARGNVLKLILLPNKHDGVGNTFRTSCTVCAIVITRVMMGIEAKSMVIADGTQMAFSSLEMHDRD